MSPKRKRDRVIRHAARRYGRLGAPILACALISLLVFVSGGSALDLGLPKVAITFHQNIAPRKLSKSEATPIALNLAGEIESLDGSDSPSLREFSLETNIPLKTDVSGLTTCPNVRHRMTSGRLGQRCRDAIVGQGEVMILLQFPENTPIPVSSDVDIFNAGVNSTGTVTLQALAYLTVPSNSAVVITFEISKPAGKSYSRWVATVPEIVGGHGSLISFDLTFSGRFDKAGKRAGVFSAKCPRGVAHTRAEAEFADGTYFVASLEHHCS